MITVQVDGATNGTTGKSGAGIYIRSGNDYLSYEIPLGTMSNHEAEFYAVIHALKICNEKFPNDILAFQTDSKIVVDSIENEFVRNELFQPLLQKITTLSAAHPHFFIKWIPNGQNNNADILAKRAIHLND